LLLSPGKKYKLLVPGQIKLLQVLTSPGKKTKLPLVRGQKIKLLQELVSIV
jgi:hypothetical protein